MIDKQTNTLLKKVRIKHDIQTNIHSIMEIYHHIYSSSSRSSSSQSPSSRSSPSVVGDGGAGLEEEERCGRGREGKDGHKEPGHKVNIIYYI